MYKQNFELDAPAALRVIENLSNEELKELLNDDEKFEDVIKNVEQVNDFHFLSLFFFNFDIIKFLELLFFLIINLFRLFIYLFNNYLLCTLFHSEFFHFFSSCN